MLLIEEALKLVLSRNAEVTALIAGRAFPGVLPQKVDYPAVAFRIAPGGEHIEHLDNGSDTPGTSRGSSGLAKTRINFFSTSHGVSNYAQARILDETIRVALQGFNGVVANDESTDSLEIHGISALAEYYQYDDRTETHQMIRPFEVWAAERQPLSV